MQVKKKKLKEIVDISLGHSFRGKIEGNDNGNIFVIQAKDVKDNYIISDFDKLAKIHHSINIEKILKKGDILLSNRGYFNATLFNLGKDTIAASSVYILKPKKDIFLPEYLVIWINSNKGQNKINKNVTGAMIKTILKQDLENLKIDIPSLEKQKMIVGLYKNKENLENKLKRKQEIIENIFQGTLLKTIN